MLRGTGLVVIGLCALPVLAQAQPAADRYGPAPQSAAQAQVQASPLRGRMLSWPGKMAAQPAFAAVPAAYAPPQPARFQARGYASYPAAIPAARSLGMRRFGGSAPSPAPVYAASPAPRAAPQAAPDQQGWRPVFAATPPQPTGSAVLAGAPAGRASPSSIYAGTGYSAASRAAAAPPPARSAAQRYGYDPTISHTVRFYSVGRPFGLRPDPAPIPPQFFTATADLAAPPADAPVERTVATGANGSHAVRAAPDTSVN